MSIRTPSTSQTRQTLLDLERTKERIATNQTRIASGYRITNPGDDPTAAASILDLGNSIQANTQFVKQADSALSYLTASEDVVTEVINNVIRLQELTASGNSSSAPEVDSIRTNLLGLANTQVQGKYLFAGTQTLGTVAHPLPFEDAAPPAGPVNYWGNSGTINLAVTATTSVTTNIPGDTAFFGAGQGSTSDLFKAVTDLRDGFSTNNNALITSATANLTTVLNSLIKVRTDLGGRQSQLLNMKDILSGFNLTLQGLQGAQQNTDYPEAITEFSSDQTIQSATLSVLAKANKTNLFDYLA